MKVVVVDASYILSFLLPDERSETVRHLVQQYSERQIGFIAPNLLPYEVANGIRSAIAQGRLTLKKAVELFGAFLEMHVAIIPVEYNEVLQLAIEDKITVYDASYVWLAHSRQCDLITHDAALFKSIQ